MGFVLVLFAYKLRSHVVNECKIDPFGGNFKLNSVFL